MSLDDITSGGSYDPIVKYNAKAGRWTLRVSKDDERDVDSPVFVADFENVKKGWVKFIEGMAPDEQLVSVDEPLPQQPSVDHKKVIVVRLFSESAFGGVAKFSPTSMHALNALSTLYGQYVEGKQAGKLPVVKFAGTESMKDKMGTNFKPIFEIVKYVDRPAAFDGDAAETAAPVSTPSPETVAPASSASEF